MLTDAAQFWVPVLLAPREYAEMVSSHHVEKVINCCEIRSYIIINTEFLPSR